MDKNDMAGGRRTEKRDRHAVVSVHDNQLKSELVRPGRGRHPETESYLPYKRSGTSTHTASKTGKTSETSKAN